MKRNRGQLLFASCAALLMLVATGCVTRVPSDELELAREQGIPALIYHIAPRSPNSVGGVLVIARAMNTSESTIKYIYITVYPYNAVGDMAPSSINGQTEAVLEMTGPIEPGKFLESGYANVWYNSTIDSMRITKIEVVFMDGRSVSYEGDDVTKLLYGAEARNPAYLYELGFLGQRKSR